MDKRTNPNEYDQRTLRRLTPRASRRAAGPQGLPVAVPCGLLEDWAQAELEDAEVQEDE